MVGFMKKMSPGVLALVAKAHDVLEARQLKEYLDGPPAETKPLEPESRQVRRARVRAESKIAKQRSMRHAR